MPPETEGENAHQREQEKLTPYAAKEGGGWQEAERGIETAERGGEEETHAAQRGAGEVGRGEEQQVVDGAVEGKGKVELDGHGGRSFPKGGRMGGGVPLETAWTKYSAAGVKNRSQLPRELRPVVRQIDRVSARRQTGTSSRRT